MLDQLARLEAATATIHAMIRDGASYPTIVNRLSEDAFPNDGNRQQ